MYTSGNCTAGEYCQGGAASSVPDDSNANYPENGPCQVGHYCPEGTLRPVECEVGTLRNVTGMYHKSYFVSDTVESYKKNNCT